MRAQRVSRWMPYFVSLLVWFGALIATLPVASAVESSVEEGTLVQRGNLQVIPERFLRRWDPVTYFFDEPVGLLAGGPEHQPERFVSMSPKHPGVYTWIDAKTLQFRPAESWPALSRFVFTVGQKRYSLVTLMEAPIRSIPSNHEEGLDPVERITLTFAEPLDADSLRQMVRVGVRPLPGIDEAQTRWLDHKDFTLKVIERVQRNDPASYVLTFARPIPSGQRAIVRLRLSLEDGLAESFKDVSFSTSESFRITALGCASLRLPVTPEGVSYARDQSLACDANQRTVQVDFSSAPKVLSPIEARNLVRFTPAVDGLSYETRGRTLFVEGRFQPDTLYRATLMPVPLSDAQGRPLTVKAASEVYLHFPPKPKYLDWQVGHGIVERFGPQQLPLEGRGFGRVDIRVYPVDPLGITFWPFPQQSVKTDEQGPPPAPGEEPAAVAWPPYGVDINRLSRSLRLLGSPPVSTIVKLPLAATGSAARFGIDLKPHFEAISGARQPGTYLVGIRRIDESTQRDWVRVQVTDLSLTTIDENDGIRFVVNSLSSGAPVAGAEILVEGTESGAVDRQKKPLKVTFLSAETGADGTYFWAAPGAPVNSSRSVVRVVVRLGQDVLVLDPNNPGERYADNQWNNTGERWLQWVLLPHWNREEPERTLCHIFTERPVYRPEEKVYVKGYVRQRHRGALGVSKGDGTLIVEGPGGLSWQYPVDLSANGSFDYVFDEDTAPTGPYSFTFRDDRSDLCSVSVLKEAYRIPEFDLRLSAPDQVPLDREFKTQLAVQYYAGGQAVGLAVRWRVTQFPYAWTPKAYPGFFFSSDGRFSGRERFQGSAAIERKDETDAQGGAVLTLNPAIETTGQPRSYVIEATVTGADDQTVTTTQRVLALPAVVLGVKVPRYFERAKRVSPEIIVVGPDGGLVANHDVTVRLVKREWHSYLRPGDFTQADAKYINEVVDKKVSEHQVKSGAQPISVPLSLEGAGVYIVELETQDRLGRSQKVAVDFYAGGDEPVSWSRPPSDVFNVSPDKSRYEPGDTAHLVLESPYQEAQGLAIIEAPEGNHYQWFTVRNGTANFDVPIRKHFVPRIPVHFVLMRGRLSGVVPVAGSRIDLGKPATVAATRWLNVEPVEHQVTVTLENPARALPGETVSVKIALRNREGKPVSGEATLWLVDQAVLALGKEQRLDPIPDFITPVTSHFGLRETRNWIYGILPLSEQPGGDGAGKEIDENLLDNVTLRRDFVSVPYFNPAIEIGASGEATVRVKLPDNLTNFKLRAKAISGPDRFGVGTGQVSVRLPLIVQPALPRFVRPGDVFTATAIGRIVEGEGGAVVADMNATGINVTGKTQRTLTFKYNEPQRIEYQVSVPTPPVSDQGEVSYSQVGFTFAVERKADKARDGFEVKLPVRPDREKLSLRKLIDLKPGEVVEVPGLPEPARSGSVRRELFASDQPVLVRMAVGLSFLLDYPHGCTEQRISRARAFLAMKAFNQQLARKGQEEQLKRTVEEVLEWLPSVVDNNGLVSYWPGATGYVSLTAWVTEFLVEARNAGFLIDAAMLDRFVATLKQALRSDYSLFISGEAYSERVMALRALAAAGRSDPAYLAELARRTDYLNVESSAQILRLLYVNGDRAEGVEAALSKKVWDGIVIRLYQGREIYGGLQKTASSRNGLILPSETRTLSDVLRASVAAPKADPRSVLLTDALVTLGQDDGWGSTQANASAMLALADVLKGNANQEGVKQKDASIMSSLMSILKGESGKGEVQKLGVTIGSQSKTLEIGAGNPIALFSSNSSSEIALRSQATKSLIVRAETSYLPQALGAYAPSGASGFIVTRELLRQRGGNEPADKVRLSDLGMVVPLRVGDVVEDHVEVVSNLDRHFVAVVVPLAAGMEPLNPKLATAPPEATPTGRLTTAPSYVAYLDDQVTFYYDSLPKGTHHFYFRTRATVAGKFTQPQARAELMYDETVHGESVGARIDIGAAER